MKKIKTIFLALGILIASNSFGQDEVAAPGIRFGVKAGINLANISSKFEDPIITDFSTNSLLGITGGFFATIPGGAGFAVQPELNYSRLGFKDKGGDGKLLLNYLTIPVLAKYSFETSGFGAYLGPQFGYLLSAKGKSEGQTSDVKEEFKSTDISGIIGVEYFLPMGVGLSARYQLGLTNIATERGTSAKNKALTFTLGYKF